MAMKDKAKALLWLTKSKEYPAHTLEDKEVHTPRLRALDFFSQRLEPDVIEYICSPAGP